MKEAVIVGVEVGENRCRETSEDLFCELKADKVMIC